MRIALGMLYYYLYYIPIYVYDAFYCDDCFFDVVLLLRFYINNKFMNKQELHMTALKALG